MGRTVRRSASSSSATRATRVSRRAIAKSTLLLRCDTVKVTTRCRYLLDGEALVGRDRSERRSARQEAERRHFVGHRRSGCGGLFGRSVMSLISDDRLKEANNLLLPGGHDVELPT